MKKLNSRACKEGSLPCLIHRFIESEKKEVSYSAVCSQFYKHTEKDISSALASLAKQGKISREWLGKEGYRYWMDVSGEQKDLSKESILTTLIFDVLKKVEEPLAIPHIHKLIEANGLVLSISSVRSTVIKLRDARKLVEVKVSKGKLYRISMKGKKVPKPEPNSDGGVPEMAVPPLVRKEAQRAADTLSEIQMEEQSIKKYTPEQIMQILDINSAQLGEIALAAFSSRIECLKEKFALCRESEKVLIARNAELQAKNNDLVQELVELAKRVPDKKSKKVDVKKLFQDGLDGKKTDLPD